MHSNTFPPNGVIQKNHICQCCRLGKTKTSAQRQLACTLGHLQGHTRGPPQMPNQKVGYHTSEAWVTPTSRHRRSTSELKSHFSRPANVNHHSPLSESDKGGLLVDIRISSLRVFWWMWTLCMVVLFTESQCLIRSPSTSTTSWTLFGQSLQRFSTSYLSLISWQICFSLAPSCAGVSRHGV